MKLIKTKRWSPLDITCLKWSSVLFGMIIGAYFSDFTKQYVAVIICLLVLLALKPLISYFRDSE